MPVSKKDDGTQNPGTPDNEELSVPDHTHIHRQPSVTTTDTTEADVVTSAKTFDVGTAVYGVLAVTSLLGMGYVGTKKFWFLNQKHGILSGQRTDVYHHRPSAGHH